MLRYMLWWVKTGLTDVQQTAPPPSSLLSLTVGYITQQTMQNAYIFIKLECDIQLKIPRRIKYIFMNT